MKGLPVRLAVNSTQQLTTRLDLNWRSGANHLLALPTARHSLILIDSVPFFGARNHTTASPEMTRQSTHIRPHRQPKTVALGDQAAEARRVAEPLQLSSFVFGNRASADGLPNLALSGAASCMSFLVERTEIVGPSIAASL
jgi:hypothetical protein